MSHLIDSALIKSFIDADFGLPFSSESKSYDPKPGIAWAEVFVVHAQPSISTMGQDGQDLIQGFLQINLNYPAGNGDGAAKQKATEIRNHFKAGSKHSYTTRDVFIANAGRGISRNIDSWYQVIVTINWYSRITR